MTFDLRQGDILEVLKGMPSESVHMVATSPPYYGLRDYGTGTWVGSRDPEKWPKQSRNDHSPQHAKRSTGVKPKDLIGGPWMLIFALRADGWHLRSDIIWEKKSPMPESVKDRPTKSHEYIFLLSKSARYFYDIEATKEPCSADTHARYSRGRSAKHKYSEGTELPIEVGRRAQNIQKGFEHMRKVPAGWHQGNRAIEGIVPSGQRDRLAGVGPKTDERGLRAGKQNASMMNSVVDVVGTRNRRSVWRVGAQPFKGAHFATWPEKLVLPMIQAGTSERGVCRGCGAPWKRITEFAYANPGNRQTNGPRSKERRHETCGFDTRLVRISQTVGWEPSCKCFSGIFPMPEPVPATVLDPFCGAGSTGVVARKYGRNFIGIDLKQDYLDMARKRIDSAIPLPAEQPQTAAPIIEESEESYEASEVLLAARNVATKPADTAFHP